MLSSNESLFVDHIPLDFDYIPKIIKCREKEQRQFAYAIKPLLLDRNGKNVFVHGPPGVGKTVACKWVLKDLEEETEGTVNFYINCWKHNTSYKILTEMCNQLGIKFVNNLKSNELLDRIKRVVNKKAGVFVFDEFDKCDDTDILYMLIEEIYRKSIFLISNFPEVMNDIDPRLTSRLNLSMLGFAKYNEEEIRQILEERRKFAFVAGCWKDDAFEKVAEECADQGDVRFGLTLMREAGTIVEERSGNKIELEDVYDALDRLKFTINKEEDLDTELKKVLKIIKENDGEKIGELFKKYEKEGGEFGYKTFKRKVNELKKGKFIATERKSGDGGNTTIVKMNKKLTDF